jgi:2',3'-cyclic-nucleotide 2'-phosphodiesterase (5'-nucleotidase family)
MYLKKNTINCFLFLVAITFYSCTKPPQVNYTTYKINTQPNVDSVYSKMLAPYKDSLNKSMNEVIGFATNGLSKKQPESVLGNFMTDAIKIMAEKMFGKKIDAAFINYGGIRSLKQNGEVSVGKIFELMPFDNLVVLQQLKGFQLKQFLNKVCEKGGWPVSKGLTYSIKEKQLGDVLIDEKPIIDSKVYTIANSDYIANGGDDCAMLKSIPQQNIYYSIRDALIEYIKLLSIQGYPLNAKIENRVVYAKQ